jgi:hypothetical protein
MAPQPSSSTSPHSLMTTPPPAACTTSTLATTALVVLVGYTGGCKRAKMVDSDGSRMVSSLRVSRRRVVGRCRLGRRLVPWFKVCSGRHATGNELQCNYKWRCQREMAWCGYCKMYNYHQVHMLILHFWNSSTCMRFSWVTRIVISSVRWSLKCIVSDVHDLCVEWSSILNGRLTCFGFASLVVSHIVFILFFI